MSLESPDNEKNFPGLYKQGSLLEPPTEDETGVGKKRDANRKKDGKRDKKEKGYTMFEEEESEEELVIPEDIKSPTKAKKTKPGFKFPAKKDIFPRMKEKEEKKDKEAKKEEKEKKKEEKEGKKLKTKDKKKIKLTHIDITAVAPPVITCENPIFGIPLALAVERNKSHDGIELPAIVRECIDYVEECGLTCEGIYRISGVKSKVQHLKDCYNKGIPVDLVEHEPNIVASLLKQFLRELPEPVLTTTLMPKFEEASIIKNEHKKVDMFIRLIEELPACNRLLLSWMIVHMTHIIELQKQNKMSLQNVSIVLSPTMQISHRVLNVLFTYAHQIFKDTYLRKYVPPLKPATSRWSLELPDNTGALEEELAKQESLLNQLHGRLNAGVGDTQMEEQLWEVQRVVTQLKRKIKFAKKPQGTAERRRKELEVKRSSQLSETEELHLELRQAPTPPLISGNKATVAAVVEMHQEEQKRFDSRVNAAGGDVIDDRTIDQTDKEENKEIGDAPGDEAKSDQQNKLTDNITTNTSAEKHASHELQTGEIERVQEPSSASEKRISQENPSTENQEITAASVNQTENALSGKEETHEIAESKTENLPPTTESSAEANKNDSEGKDSTLRNKECEPEANKNEEESHLQNQELEHDIGESVEIPEVIMPGSDGRQIEVDTIEREKDESSVIEDSHRGGGEIGSARERKDEEAKVRIEENEDSHTVTILEEKEVKPRGPVQVHPHLYLSLEPLQPIKAQPLKPRRDRADKTLEENQHKSAKLRELEEELLGDGLKDRRKEAADQVDGEKVEEMDEEDYDFDEADDEELQGLIEEEFTLRLEEEELLAIGDELRKKIETEESEIERLQQEIQELQYLRHDSDLEEMSSGSDSSYESEDEEDLNDMLSSLIQENLQLERQNADLCQKIHEERMICLSVKLQIRVLQQKQLESSQNSVLTEI